MSFTRSITAKWKMFVNVSGNKGIKMDWLNNNYKNNNND